MGHSVGYGGPACYSSGTIEGNVTKVHPPSIRSFLIADQVFQQRNGKWCIIGIFDRILVQHFPAVHHSLGLFVQLSDAEGAYDVRVEFRDSNDRVLTAIEGIKVEVTGRLSSTGLGIQTCSLPLLAPGKYFFKLFFNGEFATDIPLDVVAVETQEGQAE